MDFHLTEDQQALVTALQSILQNHAELPQDEKLNFFYHNARLQALLTQQGFLSAARDIGPLEAAMVIYEAAKNLSALDTIGCGLVAPMILPDEIVQGPVALATQRQLGGAIRNLPIARHLLVDCGEDVALMPVAADMVAPVTSIYGYPYGRFTQAANNMPARIFPGLGAQMRAWWRIGIAAEIAGAGMAAMDYMLDHVRQRKVFGKPVGAFQAVQHRLVERFGHVKSTYYLAMRAAWSQDATDADAAAHYAQQGISALLFDLHQFAGGMGMTTEYPLHFWTYRIRALQSEAQGPNQAALDIAARRWPSKAVGTGA